MKKTKIIIYKGKTYTMNFSDFEDEQKVTEHLLDKIFYEQFEGYKRGMSDAFIFLREELEKAKEKIKELEHDKGKGFFRKFF